MSHPSDGPRESSADARAMARGLFDLFNAMMQEGFSEAQALTIIGQVLAVTAPRDDK